jgi:hypothetical protein
VGCLDANVDISLSLGPSDLEASSHSVLNARICKHVDSVRRKEFKSLRDSTELLYI